MHLIPSRWGVRYYAHRAADYTGVRVEGWIGIGEL